MKRVVSLEHIFFQQNIFRSLGKSLDIDNLSFQELISKDEESVSSSEEISNSSSFFDIGSDVASGYSLQQNSSGETSNNCEAPASLRLLLTECALKHKIPHNILLTFKQFFIIFTQICSLTPELYLERLKYICFEAVG